MSLYSGGEAVTVEALSDLNDRYICDCCGVAVIAALRDEKYAERIRSAFGHANSVSVTFDGEHGGCSLRLDVCLKCIERGAKLPSRSELLERFYTVMGKLERGA